ncbi:MAG: sugar-binding domain-containing protein [Phycisphaerae bacterium]|jgi:beta-mannosidase
MAKEILDLTGTWQFKQYPVSARRMRDLDEGNWLNCTVPSSIYTNLVEAKVIDGNRLTRNPEEFFPMSLESWIYRKNFSLPANFQKNEKIELVFDGLDTFGQIWMNGKIIGKTDNMFCKWRFDVTSLIKEKNNELLVKFDSAAEEGNRLMNRFGLLSRDSCSLPQRTYARKAQCQFGWDWAPRMPGCGIWQPVRLEAFKAGSIGDVHVTTIDCDKSNADIKISVQVENFSQQTMTCNLSITNPAGKTAATASLNFSKNHLQASAVIKIVQPQLWWPRPYGSQPLYKLNAELHSGNERVDSASKNFGIRMVKLNQTPDEHGQSFQFEVNNQPVYAKGADWIPPSLYIGSAKAEDYEKLLTAVVDANINMLRVWGGGVYETETFYNLCDRLGILVWQDFMFACAYYPDRTWFTEMIKKEATQNIVRLRNHPSLALWCGNNEIDWIHSFGGMGKSKKFYGKNIYHKILPPLVHELDPDRDYISSTPLGPAKNPNDPSVGTVHQWNIWSGLKPTDDYLTQIPSFVSEFGFQSLPCKKMIWSLLGSKKTHTADWHLEKHDYQPNGAGRLHYYINELFRAPANIDEFIYLSQITQARAIRKNVEHLRTNSDINSGVIFWQFNDSCPAISWSCLDYAGGKKALYYYTRRFHTPVIVTASAQRQESSGTIDSITASVVNHSVSPITALLLCRIVDTNFEIIDEFKRPVSVGPGSVEKVLLPQSFATPKNNKNSFLHILLQNDTEVISENSFFYVPDKYFDFPACNVETKAERLDELNWKLTLKSGKLAKDLYIDCDFDADLNDNYFDLLNNKPKSIIIKTNTPVNDIGGKIKVISVNSIFTKVR